MKKDQKKDQKQVKRILCTHLKKLTKNEVLKMLQNPAEVKCETHKFHVSDQTICLHCNKIFCGLNSSQKCISSHQTLNSNHVFSLNCQNQTIFCSECGQTIEYMIEIYSNESQNQDVKKLKRFAEFIHETYKKLKLQIQESKKCQQEMKYRGLQNMGNTCFLNTVLQVLNHSFKFVELYKQFKFTGNNSIKSTKKSISKEIEYFYDQVIQQGQSKVWHVVTKKNQSKNTYETNAKLIKTITNCKFNQLFQQFIEEMSKIKQIHEPFQPVSILDFLSHVDKKYSLQEEQDAEEALLFIIDILVQGELVSMGYDMERYANVEKFIGRQKISPTQRMFGCYLLSQIYCQNCKKINYTLDLTYHISINIPTTSNNKSINQSLKKHLSQKLEMKQKFYHTDLNYPSNKNNQSQLVLPQFLKEFFQQERLTHKENYYKCSNCNSLVGLKKFYLVDLPQILIVSIKRFDHKMIKNSKHVNFQQKIDLKDITLIPVNQDDQEQKITTTYSLYGVIVHLGDTIHNGHYICFVKTSSNIWLRCSDHNVKKVTWNEVKQQQAYVLMYQLKKQ